MPSRIGEGHFPHRPSRRRALRVLLSWVAAVLIAVSLGPVVLLRWVDPPVTAFMLEGRREAAREGRDGWRIEHEWVEFEDVAPGVALAVIAAEDQKFLDHHGFDVEAIAEAWEEYREGGRRRGASTISQQVARNLFLWRGGGFLRKGLEAVYTFLIEALWTKRRILEVYLNVAEFGDGVYGVAAASRLYFGKPPSRLTRQDAALLAAVLPSPRRMHPDHPSPYVRTRARAIMDSMSELGPTVLDRI